MNSPLESTIPSRSASPSVASPIEALLCLINPESILRFSSVGSGCFILGNAGFSVPFSSISSIFPWQLV